LKIDDFFLGGLLGIAEVNLPHCFHLLLLTAQRRGFGGLVQSFPSRMDLSSPYFLRVFTDALEAKYT
jgi:hypothetical protein